jgi:hypothetical protein
MKKSSGSHEIVPLALALLCAGACSTQEVGPSAFALTTTQVAADQGVFTLLLAPDADNQEQALLTQTQARYFVRIDGQWAMISNGDPTDAASTQVLQVGTGGFGSATGPWLTSGPHTFELVDQAGKSAGTVGPYTVEPGRINRLLFFGRRAALRSTFVADDLAVPRGKARVSLVNVLRPEQPLEMVQCADVALTTCTALSSPIAYGEAFTDDVPSVAEGQPLFPTGVGYRQVPRDGLPNPPVNWLIADRLPSLLDPTDTASGLFFSAPIFMSPEGYLQQTF